MITMGSLYAQEYKKEFVYVSIGYPSFNNLALPKRNFLIEMSYTKEFNNLLSWEVVFSRSSINSLFDELKSDKEEVIDFLNNSNYDLFQTFGLIVNNSAGVKLHLSILNNEKNYLSFSPGIGIFRSNSSKFMFKGAIITTEDNQTSTYVIDSDPPDTKSVFGYLNNYSLQYFNFFSKHKYFIGTKIQLNKDRSNISVDRQAFKSNYWGFSIVCGIVL